jgi:ribosomal protein S18 acetylase RimI-like enzyme
MTAVVRRLDADEWETYRRVRLAGLQADPQAFESRFEDELRLTEADWRERLTTAARWVAFSGGSAVGLVGALHEVPEETLLISLWVDASARGTGVGGRLVDAVIEAARAHGSSAVNLWVAEDNELARSVYRAKGFTLTGRIEPVDEANPQRGLECEMRLEL